MRNALNGFMENVQVSMVRVHGALTSVIDFECGTCQRSGHTMIEPFELEDRSLEVWRSLSIWVMC